MLPRNDTTNTPGTEDGRHNDRASRRTFLAGAGALGFGLPLGYLQIANAFTGSGIGSLKDAIDRIPICSTAATTELEGPPRAIKLAWNATAICTSAAPVAKERGFFARHNLDVEFVNFGGSTSNCSKRSRPEKQTPASAWRCAGSSRLSRVSTFALLREFTAAACGLLGSKAAGIDSLESLKGKTVAISDQASPTKNFFSIFLLKQGIAPESIQWRQYPANLLSLAVEKGEAHALADADPLTFLWLKEGKLNEVATNFSGEYANRTCCVLAIRGGLVRDQKPVATALTRAVLEAGDHVGHDPADWPPCFLRTAAKVL